MRHYNKIIPSLALIVVLLLGINIVTFAIGEEIAIGGIIDAALAAGGVTSSVTGTMTTDEYNRAWNNLLNNDPLWLENLSDYEIYYQKNAKIVDGIPYDYVYVNNQIAQYAADEGIALLTDKSITDYSTGQLISGNNQGTTSEGVYVYRTNANSAWQTPLIRVPLTSYNAFGYSWNTVAGSGTNWEVKRTLLADGTTSYLTWWTPANYPPTIYYAVLNGYWYVYKVNAATSGSNRLQAYSQYPVTTINGDLDYETEEIDLTVPTNYGLEMYIPSGYIDSTIEQGTFYPGDDSIPDILFGITSASAENDMIDSAFVDGHILPPEPTVEPSPVIVIPSPYPTTIPEDDNMPIGTAPWGWLKDLINEGILTLDDVLDNIAEKVAELAETIVNGTEEFIRGVFGDIPNVFGGWFTDLKNSFGIWHYVVEWWQCIASYFSFLMTIASGMPSCFIAPLYAVVAGTIVLGVYKRFGQ